MRRDYRKIKFSFGCAIAAVSFLILTIVLQKSSNGNETSVSKNSFKFENHGDKTRVEYGIKRDKNGQERAYMRTKNLIAVKTLELDGFQDNIELCQTSQFEIGASYGRGICFTGDVGAHSKNIVLVKQNGKKFEAMYFQDGVKSYNITTDVPAFDLSDQNNDKITDIKIEYRDYDRDPLTQKKIEQYLGNGKGFVFEREIL